MKNLAEKFLSESDKKKIQNAVKEIEKITSGEIVPMVVSSSYSYPVSNYIGGFIFAFIIALLCVFILEDENLWLFLSIFMPAFIVMYVLIKYSMTVKKLFISDKEINEEVEEAAITQFFKHQLYKTKDQTGILLYISVFEKKVWILADHGINSKVEPNAWEKIVDLIVKGIKTKRQGEAIPEAIRKIGEMLCEHFPCKDDDTDELKNLIIGK
ncbi:MAG: TPM domain-containing protein [Spirochaetes bacterium]|nr:TPM domain-containing protein [Spirochaetota bacterium]